MIFSLVYTKIIIIKLAVTINIYTLREAKNKLIQAFSINYDYCYYKADYYDDDLVAYIFLQGDVRKRGTERLK